MIEGSCHCGAVRVEVPAAPSKVTDCNCSICRRLGALWACYPADRVRIAASKNATTAYVWEDRSLAFHTCRTCGCTTQWLPVARTLEPERMGVNARLFDSSELAGAKIRRFDGADAWSWTTRRASPSRIALAFDGEPR